MLFSISPEELKAHEVEIMMCCYTTTPEMELFVGVYTELTSGIWNVKHQMVALQLIG